MCYHKSLTAKLPAIAAYYEAEYNDAVNEQYKIAYHENGFDYKPSPIVTAEAPKELKLYNWGFVPWFTKTEQDALQIRLRTLNCISEEMFEKASFRDAVKEGRRCLIPCTGFYEWRWLDPKGKTKIPYYIHLEPELFSLAGLYSTWRDKVTGKEMNTYTVLTNKANVFMSKIHNSKDRMPVIIPRQYEKDFLNPDLSKEDVFALCSVFQDSQMKAHTISKLITSKKEETDVPEVMKMQHYDEVDKADTPTLFM
jgi:putative SOS response-associated peptidase YedK